MNLTATLAARIYARYAGSVEVYGYSESELAFSEVLQRRGGMFAVITEAARRDFILTLGANRRKEHRARIRREAKFAALRNAAAPSAIAAE